VADESLAPWNPLLADVLARLDYEDRVALLEHAAAAVVHAQTVAERLRAAAASEPFTRRQVEIHLLAAICHLELAAGALGIGSAPAAPRRPWWRAWWPWGCKES
jgi:hypothetical protein